jgi:hypothetical protein
MTFKFVVGALTYLSLVGPSLGAGKKVDVFGITTGMPMEAVATLGSDRGWLCKANEYPLAISFDCIAKESQKISLTFANALPAMPLVEMVATFSAVGKTNVIAALSEQYGPPRQGSGYWNLGNGAELQLQNEVNERTFYLELSNETLRLANVKAVEKKDAAKNPTLKF